MGGLPVKLSPQALINEWIVELGLGKLVMYSQPQHGSSGFICWVISVRRCESDLGPHADLYILGDLVRVAWHGCSVKHELRMASPDFFDDLYSLLWGSKSD